MVQTHEARPVPPPEGLRRDASLSGSESGSGNWLVHADLHEAVPRLGLEGEVRCVCIDPPYNNQERYAHYDDTASHAEWLAQMEASLDVLWPLLRTDGSLWISIDDRQVHHLKVAADRVLGRNRFVTTIVWQQRTTRENRRVFSNDHEYMLVYAREPRSFGRARNDLPLPSSIVARYKNPDDDPRGPWQSVSANVQGGHGTRSQFYELVAPSGKRHHPPAGRCWVYNQTRMREEITAGNLWFGQNGRGAPRLKRFLSTARPGVTPPTLWTAREVGTNSSAKKHLKQLLPDVAVFDTPKPEALLQRVLHIASDPGDLVLDAYLGSGTTAAVAHKLGRRWVGIERGDHIRTHCVPRLRAVIDGEQGGISRSLGWTGGGAYDFLLPR